MAENKEERVIQEETPIVNVNKSQEEYIKRIHTLEEKQRRYDRG